eukprot:TRINITY_DN371_c0_g2_i1.p1 TRINITY_DN371_c0_g2~~TRINITY_DN371_c0_g2_i1.p1  ORF type:complete len:610 (-),score=206.47 TRINITY_DN371_c0_g2_i1:19-1848(-)
MTSKFPKGRFFGGVLKNQKQLLAGDFCQCFNNKNRCFWLNPNLVRVEPAVYKAKEAFINNEDGSYSLGNKGFIVKVFEKNGTINMKNGDNYQQEVALLQQMAGFPGIIQLEEIFEDEEQIVCITVDHGNPFYCLLKEKTVDEIRLKSLFSQVFKSLEVFHSQGLTHKDICLFNLVFDHQDTVTIIDLGNMKRIKKSMQLCKPDNSGKRGFQAPEVRNLRSFRPGSAESYSVGIVLLSILSKRLPDKLWCSPVFRTKLIESLNVSEDLKSFVSGLVEEIPELRIVGDEVTSHQWFKDEQQQQQQYDDDEEEEEQMIQRGRLTIQKSIQDIKNKNKNNEKEYENENENKENKNEREYKNNDDDTINIHHHHHNLSLFERNIMLNQQQQQQQSQQHYHHHHLQLYDNIFELFMDEHEIDDHHSYNNNGHSFSNIMGKWPIEQETTTTTTTTTTVDEKGSDDDILLESVLKEFENEAWIHTVATTNDNNNNSSRTHQNTFMKEHSIATTTTTTTTTARRSILRSSNTTNLTTQTPSITTLNLFTVFSGLFEEYQQQQQQQQQQPFKNNVNANDNFPILLWLNIWQMLRLLLQIDGHSMFQESLTMVTATTSHI